MLFNPIILVTRQAYQLRDKSNPLDITQFRFPRGFSTACVLNKDRVKDCRSLALSVQEF